jgi:hypothetical protein
MIEMKVRYEVSDVNIKISNVTPRDAESYILLTASDAHNNEIVFALSPNQAEYVENELYEANRRRKEHSSAASTKPSVNLTNELQISESNLDQVSH